MKDFGSLADANEQFPSEDSVDHSRASTNDIGAGLNGEAMQGVEGSSNLRVTPSWVSVNAANAPNSVKPSIEADDRPKSGTQVGSGFSHGYQNVQQSPTNGDSSVGPNSPYGRSKVNPQGQNYQRTANPGHNVVLPPITQAAPGAGLQQSSWPTDQTGPFSEGDFNNWVGHVEAHSIWHPEMDDFAQVYPEQAFLPIDYMAEQQRTLTESWNSY